MLQPIPNSSKIPTNKKINKTQQIRKGIERVTTSSIAQSPRVDFAKAGFEEIQI